MTRSQSKTIEVLVVSKKRRRERGQEQGEEREKEVHKSLSIHILSHSFTVLYKPLSRVI